MPDNVEREKTSPRILCEWLWGNIIHIVEGLGRDLERGALVENKGVNGSVAFIPDALRHVRNDRDEDAAEGLDELCNELVQLQKAAWRT